MALPDRLRNAWNAFVGAAANTPGSSVELYGGTTSYTSVSPSRPRLRVFSQKSVVSAIYNRIAMDVAEVTLRHIRYDELGRYKEPVNSYLNDCLNFEPNVDQSPRAFRMDICHTLFDRGVAAVVPTTLTKNPNTNEVFDILALRVGDIKNWAPRHVCVEVYNDDPLKGRREEVVLEKRMVAIIENPLHTVMNEPNSMLQRLVRKLALLDSVDEAASSGKLDLIIQLPYVIKTEARRKQAEQRLAEIEYQLMDSTHGIAYTDGTEKITQLNRPVENQLLKQIEYLTALVYGQLGITAGVMDGTADEQTMLHYYNRTIEPITDAITEAMQRAFLGLSGYKRSERIVGFRDPFKLVPSEQLAELADKLTRNEIVSSNEFRGFMGLAPSGDPKADELRNSNMPQPELGAAPPAEPDFSEMDSMMSELFDGMDADIKKLVPQVSDG